MQKEYNRENLRRDFARAIRAYRASSQEYARQASMADCAILTQLRLERKEFFKGGAAALRELAYDLGLMDLRGKRRYW